MKKYVLGLAAFAIIAIAAGLFLAPGFQKRTDVCLQDFSVSEDGSVMTVKTSLFGSMGFIRAMEAEQTGNEIHCSFYNTFGGLNSRIGSKNRFELSLDASVEKIYFDRGSESDILVLERDAASNIWTRVFAP